MDVVELMKKEGLRRNYSLKTIKTYVFCLKKFLSYCRKEPRKITKVDVNNYLNKLVKKGVSGNTVNVHLCSLKFLLREILNKNFIIKIKYSKTPKRLPVVLTKEEITKMINSISNEKHKLMIKLMYSSGLRVSELVNLRVKDLQFNNNYGWVRNGKGNKDRLFIIAKSLRKDMLKFIIQEGLGEDSFVFKTYNGRINIRTVQVIVKKATKKAGIFKRVHCHALRHSFSTHLIENGYDVASVQSLLGHNSMETTMVYVHMANPSIIKVKSPLDSLDLEGKKKETLQLEDYYKKSNYEMENIKDTSSLSEEFSNLRI